MGRQDSVPEGEGAFDGDSPAIQAWDDSIGMVATTVYASRPYGLVLLGNVESGQVFSLSPGPPGGGIRAATTGRIPAVGARNTIGWIQADGHGYLVATFCQNEPSDQSGEAAMEAIADAAWAMLSS